MYNKTVTYGTQKIETISNEYKAKYEDNILKIYIPEVMPSYKNLKTHAYKNILLNIADKVKDYEGIFKNQISIFDSLIISNVIEDDNINKVFYCAKGEIEENPHTEVYITDVNNSVNLFKSMLV